jgi:hypothetical protein
MRSAGSRCEVVGFLVTNVACDEFLHRLVSLSLQTLGVSMLNINVQLPYFPVGRDFRVAAERRSGNYE